MFPIILFSIFTIFFVILIIAYFANDNRASGFLFLVCFFTVLSIVGIGISIVSYNSIKQKDEIIESFNKIDGESTIQLFEHDSTSECVDLIDKFEYKGHTYMWFRVQQLSDPTQFYAGIIHDPDCNCMIDYD